MKRVLALCLALLLAFPVAAMFSAVPAMAAGANDLEWQILQFAGTVTKTADPAGDVYSYSAGEHLANAWSSMQADIGPVLRQALEGRGEATVAFSYDVRVSFVSGSSLSGVSLRPLLRATNGTGGHTAGTEWEEDYAAYCEEKNLTKTFQSDASGNIMAVGPAVTATAAWQSFTFTLTLSDIALTEEFLGNIRWSFDNIKNSDQIAALQVRNARVQCAPSYPVTYLRDEVPAFDSRVKGYDSANLLPENAATFENASAPGDTAWKNGYGSALTMKIKSPGKDSGQCLAFEKPGTTATSYYSISLDLLKYVSEPGQYTVGFDYTHNGGSIGEPFRLAIRADREYSFAPKQSNNTAYCSSGAAPAVIDGDWSRFSMTFSVTQADIDLTRSGTHSWSFCLHMIKDAITEISLDNVFLTRKIIDVSSTTQPTDTKTWVATELTFTSSGWYADPYRDVELDLILTSGAETLTVPCFWDGQNIFRARFALPTEGLWSYATRSNVNDAGLNQRGVIRCTAYDGDLAIYRHGFVKTVPNTKYFVYDDGTPFFYLGDTHWNLGGEPTDMIEELSAQRVKQGFTVIQSEPLGSTFNCVDGISTADITGLADFDDKFFAIADKGLVHANAEFFFPSSMESFVNMFGGYSSVSLGSGVHSSGSYVVYDICDEAKTELERLSRYWVARYSAFPVLWTLGQEIDNDYYWDRDAFGSHEKWCYVNNPYKLAAQYINRYDPYKHPLSGHQEGTGTTTATNSAFRDVPAHTWYASQWSGNYASQVPSTAPKDYWDNGQGKPTVDYEGKYCYLWTKNFGARVQGYMAYLNGMFGYGWGGQDTWCYGSTYSEDSNSSDGVDTITAAEKQAATWRDSLSYPSTYQVGYMRYFFEEIVGHWENLIPRFDSSSYIVRSSGAYGFNASNAEMTDIVTYFYNFSDASLGAKPNSLYNSDKTGTLKDLKKNVPYNYLWFNPVTGAITGRGSFTTATGSWTMPAKGTGDMVLYVYQDKLFAFDYEKEQFVLPGQTLTLSVTERFSGGDTRTVTVTDFVGFDASAPGKQSVTARWTDRGQSFTVPLTVTVGAKGDLNFDGSVDASDLTLLARIVARIDTPTSAQTAVADVNGSGDVTADDLTKLARYVARIISEL